MQANGKPVESRGRKASELRRFFYAGRAAGTLQWRFVIG